MFRLIRQISPEVKLRDFLSIVMQYLYVVRGENDYIDIEKVARNEIPNAEDYMGTIAEMLERKGREEGVVIGEQRGEQRGKLETAQEMLLESLGERFGAVNQSIIDEIRSIQSREALKMLFKQSFRIESLEAFKEQVRRATEK